MGREEPFSCMLRGIQLHFTYRLERYWRWSEEEEKEEQEWKIKKKKKKKKQK